MGHPVAVERRASPRLAPPPDSGFDHVRLRPGRWGRVVDLSRQGVLIETPWPLKPGTRVDLRFGAASGLVRSATILRCHVAWLDASSIRYRGALRFDDELTGAVASVAVEIPL